jgi:hypothetical protein
MYDPNYDPSYSPTDTDRRKAQLLDALMEDPCIGPQIRRRLAANTRRHQWQRDAAQLDRDRRRRDAARKDVA